MPNSRNSRSLVAFAIAALLPLAASTQTFGSSADPQLKTDDPWYPGELSCSTLGRLFATQAELYKRVTGRGVSTDEDKALASWYWRNLHYAHGEEGKNDCFAAGFDKAEWNRDYWTGLFAMGFGLCGTTHSQWTAEMDALLGHCRGRVVGVSGHNSFEVYLTGGPYGQGRWALLDHDISTVIYSPDGSRLLSIPEIDQDLKRLTDPKFNPDRQHGWRVSGLADGDARGVYDSYRSAEYLSGYAGPPPMVHLRRGESLRRYLRPGLDDGKTFVFWGMNYHSGGIPGPERNRAWVNQPEKMYGSKNGTGAKEGQVRFANAAYTYTPDFATDAYKEGVIDEGPDHVTFEFYTPYVIACAPASDESWGIYKPGGRNGLVLHGKATCPVQLSTDSGKTWQPCGALVDGMDLTDRVKGMNQYLLRFDAPPALLKGTGLSWRTVCQCNVATIPHLHDGTNHITFHSGGRALVAAGPTKALAEAHLVDGAIGSKTATLELSAPRTGHPAHVYAVSWQASGNPPADAAYRIDYSTDAGKSWQPIVKDWRIQRRQPEPPDFWSQSFCWGDVELPKGTSGPVRIRFGNDGGKTYRKVEAYLAYEVAERSATDVTFAWTEGGGGQKTQSHTYAEQISADDVSWSLDAGKNVQTKWVEYVTK
jgi:hypothetical protein